MIEKYWTDYSLLSKRIFEVRRYDCFDYLPIISSMLTHKFIEPLRFAAGYLISKLNPVEAKAVLDKYLVAIVYLTLRYYGNNNKIDFINENNKSAFLDSLYENGITIESLINSPQENNYFNQLLNYANDATIRKTNDLLFADIVKKADDSGIKKASEIVMSLKNLIYYRLNYFMTKTTFAYFADNRRSNDLLIAEARAISYTRNFQFEIPDEDFEIFQSYCRDTRCKGNGSWIGGYIVLAQLVNYSIQADLPFDQCKAMPSSELKIYTMSFDWNLTNKRQAILGFLSEIEKLEYYPNLKKITKSFRVRYNNELYEISSSGLNKL